MRPIRLLLGSMLLALAMPALAAWPPGGRMVMLTPNSFNNTSLVWVQTLPSGDLMVRGTGVGGNSNGYAMQRLTADGDIVAGWPVNGASLGSVAKSFVPEHLGCATDANGASWQMASGSRAAVVRVSAAGVSALTPVNITSTVLSVTPMAIAPAPGGGIYAYAGTKLQRLTANATVAPGWAANGVSTLGTAGTNQAAIADGAGGVVILASTPLSGPPTLQRYDSTGVRHAGWPVVGVPVSDALDENEPDYLDAPGLPALVHGGTHVYACWTSPSTSTDKHIMVQRIGLDGSADPIWPTSGFALTAYEQVYGITAFSDGQNGLYVTWLTAGVPQAAHVYPDGTIYSTTLTQAGDSYMEPRYGAGGLAPYQHIPACATSSGGLAFAWDDATNDPELRVRWFLPDLTLDPTAPAAGVTVLPDTFKHYVRALHGAAANKVYLLWGRVKSDAVNATDDLGEVWMTQVEPVVTTGVAPGRNSLALSAARPNPARGSASFELTLPDDSAARLELLDLAGRVVQSRSVSGAGRHAITFDALERVSPGLYFVRARTRSEASTTRVVVGH